MTELTLSGIGFVYALLALSVGIVAVTFILKMWYNKLAKAKQEGLEQEKHLPKGIKSRNKHQDLNVFAISRPIWIFGLGTAMTVSLCAFSWESIPQKIEIPMGAMEYDLEMEVTRTPPPKPKPPPPLPPPVEIQEVEDEVELDETKLESMDIDETAEIVEPEPVIVDTPAPQPPAPPPPIEEEPDFFVVAEEMPRFPGCEDDGGTKEEKGVCAEAKMLQYIYSKVNYPRVAVENGIEGRAILQFVVDENGNITKANIVRNVPGGCGEEALRVVEGMPKWIAGRQRGRPVSVLYTLPVVFELRD